MGLLLWIEEDTHITYPGTGTISVEFTFTGTALWVQYSNVAEYTTVENVTTSAIYTHGPTSVETEHRR